MRNLQTLDSVLDELGFGPWREPGKGRPVPSYAGVYVLHSKGDRLYAGESRGLRGRMATHIREREVDRYRVRRTPLSKRFDVERDVIERLHGLGQQIDNINGTPWKDVLPGFVPFDDLMSPRGQRTWVASGGKPLQPRDPQRFVEQRRKYEEIFRKWSSHEQAREALSILSLYDLKRFIPEPWKTEGALWSIACRIPSLGGGVLCRVNIYRQEVFSIVARDPILVHLQAPIYSLEKRLAALKAKMKGRIEIDEDRTCEAGGADQGAVYLHGRRGLALLLEDPEIVKGIKEFNLGLIRKGRCLWARSHCPQLIDRLTGTVPAPVA